MSAPVILTSSSILGFKRNEQFEFQPFATNSPTSWAATGLPSGVTINSSTGLISGAFADAGVYNVEVAATNADPATGTQQFIFGISSELAPAFGSDDDFIDIDIDSVRGLASLAVGGDDVEEGAPLFQLKEDDTAMLAIRFRKAGVLVDPDVDTLRLVLKEFEPDAELILAEDFEKVGSGSTAQFNLPVSVVGSKIAAALSNYENDRGTEFVAQAEIEWVHDVTHGEGTVTIRRSTRTFPISIARDLAGNS